ncbi:MAG: hypothetical protein J7J09_01900 [Kosmotoga sp.]|uniref:hypothetical protein n=1 Tax=Kosmotoga sp. TaxID=1955248 RepID=UPI001D438925|nr:hypothetical protein [Kosmotoga sp.]MBO8166126.1 hypothetical protein [Kosmotoga sp.]MCD6159365.1 hypothetical protein [Kosmotoga sp.]
MKLLYILLPLLVYYDLSFYDILPLFPVYLPIIISSESDPVSLGIPLAIAFFFAVNLGSVVLLLLLALSIVISNYLFHSHLKKNLSLFLSTSLFTGIASFYLKVWYLALIPLIIITLFRERKHELQAK